MIPALFYLIEDDGLQGDLTVEYIRKEFGADVRIVRIFTEKEFFERFEELAASKPAGLIIDRMLQFADDILEVVGEVQNYKEAGLRCIMKLRADKRTANTPVLQYTVLDREFVSPLPQGVTYVGKGAPKKRLFAWMHRCM